ncbi:MAG: hypothetical protein FWH37_08395 [Candidatus Bathyarchaeota archaeon]|nr:hypothetical protein [Candidatus Termiticorpusculum sp.]
MVDNFIQEKKPTTNCKPNPTDTCDAITERIHADEELKRAKQLADGYCADPEFLEDLHCEYVIPSCIESIKKAFINGYKHGIEDTKKQQNQQL